MSSINQTVSIVIYYDAYVVDCNIGEQFKSKKNVFVSMKRDMTLNTLKRKMHQKMGLN